MSDSANIVNILLRESSSALVVGKNRFDSAQIRTEAGRWAGHLALRHLPGSHIALLSGNDEAFVFGYLGCLAAGMVAVPLNPLSPPAERQRDLAIAEVEEILIGPAFAQLAASIPPDHQVTILDAANAEGTAIDPLAGAAAVEPDDLAVLMFTSGTAGPSKPAMLTHRNLRTALLSMENSGLDLRSSAQAAVAVVPLFHIFGLNIILNLGLAIGSTLILLDEFVPAEIVSTVAQFNVSILAGPPNMWRAISTLPPASTAPLQGLQVAMSGAAPLDPLVANTLRNQHRINLREGYGLTETSGVVCSAFGAQQVAVGSVGPVMPGLECRLVDADGDDVLIGDIGEIWVKGPMISPGYFNDDAATKRSRTPDGWLRTGDLATVDDHGHISITGRTKDLVIVSGFNVHPGEVEEVLQRHAAVEAAAAVGVPDDATGERVKAFVILRAGSNPATIEDELRTFCATELARYKVPKTIEIVTELPIGVAGKLRRRDLAH